MNEIEVSIVVPTLNNVNVIGDFLGFLARQDFQKDSLEVLIVDGGSKDKTIEIAERFGAEVINNPYVLAEPGVDLGIRQASGSLIMILAVDNYLEDPEFIAKMVSVFDDSSIYAAFPKHGYSEDDSIYTRYINTFTDPFNHFIYGYSSNARTFKRVYETTKGNNLYDVYDYKANKNKPMIAFAQGFTFRSSFRRKEEDSCDDCSPVLSLIESGVKIAYVHSTSIVHHTVRDRSHFMRKQRWAALNAIGNKDYGIAHRIKVLSKSQKTRAMIWPLYAGSFILPFFRSIMGYLVDKDPIWFFHPVICWLSFYASLTAIIGNYLGGGSSTDFSRQ